MNSSLKRNSFLIYLAILFLIHSLKAQEFNPGIIELPDNLSAENFDFLKEELKDVQVVMLGENTHNDGNVFEIKTEIIKFLHKEMGFSTIAFESGVYDVWKAHKKIRSGGNVKDALRGSLLPLWAKSEQFKSFIHFYEENKHSLKLFGFDNQIPLAQKEALLVNDLYNYCQKNALSFSLNKNDLELLLETFWNSYLFDEKDISYDDYKTAFNLLLSEIKQLPKTDEHFYWELIVENLLSIGKDFYNNRVAIESTFVVNIDDNIRDRQMSQNLLAYLDRHPTEKIVCWGANVHFINDMNSVKADTISAFIPMGSYVKEKLQNKVYSLGLITAEDSIKLGFQTHKTPIDSLSFEFYLKQKKSPHIFVTSNQSSMKIKKPVRFFSPITFIEAQLNLLHDGYFFFNHVTESQFIEDLSVNKEISISKVLKRSVFDKDTGDPIPGAIVDINQNDYNAITKRDGSFELYFKTKNEIKTITVSALGYETTTINLETKRVPKRILLKRVVTSLEEVVLEEKISPYYLMKKVINKLPKNYPSKPFNSTYYFNFKAAISDSVVLNLDVVTDQYDLGYLQGIRSTDNIRGVRWNIGAIKEKTYLHNSFLTEAYRLSIKHRPFLEKNKYKKFHFSVIKQTEYKGKSIYVIKFHTDRHHFNFTKYFYDAIYSGTLYINTDDYAIVKITEKWETQNETFSNKRLISKSWFGEKNRKPLIREKESNFSKSVDGYYYLQNRKIKTLGVLIDKQNNSFSFEEKIDSYWSNFKTKNVKPILFRKEKNRIDKIKYNNKFWSEFDSKSF